ncbi:MAG: ATP-binding protein [Verrucomicrobia bacterium]|nr:ATP-binding protein [Verrucomicrobiota bacterium]
MTAKLDPRSARKHLQSFRFADLFVEDLGWSYPDMRKPMSFDHDGSKWTVTEISQLSGFRVLEVAAADADTPFPDAKTQQALWKRIAPHAVENLLIFIDEQRTRSAWLWMKREGKKIHPRRHHYLKGQPGDLFLSKLASLVVDLSELDEDGNLPITEAANRVRAGLDIETVTKAFFRDFQDEHGKLLDAIEGIPDPGERRWYASVLLNRLMFIWFLQDKRFLDVGKGKDGNINYLPEKLAASMKAGKDRFFSCFLRDLFFEGFAKPEEKREPVSNVTLGDIPYLNGGLFLPHGIEARIEGDALFSKRYSKIKVPDHVFLELLGREEVNGKKGLFARYSWSLNDTPGGDDREINPDVLGYIFEKYINQKEFGAYYTRPEITDYLCEQTIHQLVLDRVNASYAAAKKLHEAAPKAFPAPRRYDTIEDLLLHATGPVCQKVLQDILPRLSLLDPACGSGAFLVAALKTLLNLYTALIGRCEALAHAPVLQWIEMEKKQHKAPMAYWLKKKIVTENLYGVDLMEEATEIAKLRLFLSLVASAEKRAELEPLPNIEFNLLPGNSLIGLLHVDPSKFDSKGGAGVSPASSKKRLQQARISLAYEEALGFTTETTTAPTTREKQQAHIAVKQSAKYDELLRRKNERIDLYKKSTSLFKDLAALKRDIDALKTEAREILDQLLLDQFQALGIQYEQATWDAAKKKEGKPEKRPLKIADIQSLQPFHWAYEFDQIIVNRGGFDAIITNPPWDVLQTNEKEFYQNYAPSIQRKNLRIEEWIEQREKMMEDETIQGEWLNYASRFPHQWAYFKRAECYQNQISTVDGRAVGNKPNLYNLFIEYCFRLVNKGSYCGIVIPSGIYTDLGSKQLRLMLFDQTEITGLFCFENRKRIFDNVDSRFKFVVLTFRVGGKTTTFPAAFMRHDVTDLQLFPSIDSLLVPVDLIKKLSPDSVSVIEFKVQTDIEISKKMLRWPLLFGDDKGWNLELYGEELNMTRSADFFLNHPTKFPLFEGGMIWQFDHRYAEPRYWVKEADLREAFRGKRIKRIDGLKKCPKDLRNDYEVPRLAIRKIASNTNKRTLIVGLLPANSFTGNSLSVHFPFWHTKEKYNQLRFSCHELMILMAVLNSFVVDFILRSRMTTNLNLFFLYQLPIPHLNSTHPAFRPLVERAARLVGTAPEFDDLLTEVFGKKATHKTHGVTDPQDRLTLRAQIDALVARLYDLTKEEFQHILATFPLVDESVKTQTLNTYRELVKLGKFA